MTTDDRMTAGGVLLARLKALGIDYIFANSGTDFPPIIEGLAEAADKDIPLPQAIVIPHEHAAMGMAHGYYLATKRPQAVMAHTNVGLANCAIGAINAATEHIPVLLFSGRTPVVEKGRLGARTVPISWGQEMRDQASLVRETVKWDYELKFPEQTLDIVDRALAIAESTPKGPVYLSLPREVLCETCSSEGLDQPARIAPAIAHPSPAGIEEAARLLAAAKHPLIIAQRGAGSPEGFAALARLALDWGIPVVNYWAIQLAIATDHPMSVGPDPSPWLEQADVVVVIDSLAPWSPDRHVPATGCKMIHIGPDPLYARFPVRNFPVDVPLVGEIDEILLRLEDAIAPYREGAAGACAERRKTIRDQTAKGRQRLLESIVSRSPEPITKNHVSLALSKVIEGRKATVLSELGCPLEPLTLREPGAWYQEPHSGGLGWSFPCALGMQLAERDRLVVATMGDGSYMFANPVACHQIAEALDLPVLVLVLNNREWGAVRQSVLGIYPKGHAARANSMPLTSLEPTPDFTKVAEASRAWTARVDRGEDLAATLEDAVREVTENRRHALVEIRIAP